MHAFESGYPFCSNLRCELHVRAGDTAVHGFGNWVRMPDGRMIGRGLYIATSCAIPAAARKSERRFKPKPKRLHDSTHLREILRG
jgi:hypothetical protein